MKLDRKNDSTYQENFDSTYQENFSAYIDILGFKEWISAIEDGPPSWTDEELRKGSRNYTGTWLDIECALENYQASIARMKGIFSQSQHIKITQFSDSMFVLANTNNLLFRDFVFSIYWLQRNLFWIGIYVRGSISLGNVYSGPNENIIFGKGIVDAVEAESHSIYPRILVPESLVERRFIPEANAHSKASVFKKIVRQDFDGLYFIDYSVEIDPVERSLNKSGLDILNQKLDKSRGENYYPKLYWLSKLFDSYIH